MANPITHLFIKNQGCYSTYNACLATTEAIRGTSKEKLYEETGLESLQLCCCYRKLSRFYKLFNSIHPYYLFKLIPPRNSGYITKSIHNIPFSKAKHNFFKSIFFPSTIIEWNKLDHNIKNLTSFTILRNSNLKFIRQSADSFFSSYNPKGIKLATRLWLDLSPLREHRFKYNFEDFLKLFCKCGLDIESTAYHLLRCSTYF